jgi:HD-GYP domain-containing protein (c-di-GMP phosphodiesterase class II)
VTAPSAQTTVRLGEMVATLSLAADVGFGLPLETGLQVCALGLAVGERMGLDEAELDRVFYLALLRHIGCTANSDDIAAIAGDEIALRRNSARLDFADRNAMFPHVLRHVAAHNPPAGRPRALLKLLAGTSSIMQSTAAVCEAATTIAARLGLSVETELDLTVYFERWDGKGVLGTASGDEITSPAQAVQVAESANAFLQVEGLEAAAEFVRRQSGAMFGPVAANAFLHDPAGVAAALEVPSLWTSAAERGDTAVAEGDLEQMFESLADFADLRSFYLVGHSRGVAALAATAAADGGFPQRDVVTLRRAALVHDLGRVSVSARVWGKEGPLTRSEWEQVRLHPYHVERVLARPEAFAELGRLASLHHERCDGSGYFRGTRDLSPAARLLAAADALHAMTEARPHRPAMALDRAAAELRAGVRAGAYDGEAVERVLAAAGATRRTRPEGVAGLTAREIEVLRLLARGRTKRQVAKELVIAPKTADAHTQHIYAKLGVTTRAGATLFAMQNGLLDSLTD